jgi:ribosomal protein L35
MPKQKTKSGAKKRFKLTGSGKIKRKHAFKRHKQCERAVAIEIISDAGN